MSVTLCASTEKTGIDPVRITPSQAAKKLNIHPATLRRIVAREIFTVIPYRPGERGVGKRYYLVPEEVEIYGTKGEEALREFRAKRKRQRSRSRV